MGYVDLHVHSNISDGTYSIKELVDYACEKQLTAFALTDHDTIDGLKEAMEYAKGTSVEVIPGIELSTEYLGRDIHILGLFLNPAHEAFRQQLNDFQASRMSRNEKMAEKLREKGFDITLDALQERFPQAIITRAHFARYLKESGQIRELKDAFEKYIGDGCSCYVPKETVTPEDGIRNIMDAGGIAILAHPALYHLTEAQLDQLLISLKSVGLTGIEGIYSTHSPVDDAMVRRLAKKHDLLLSGGSDFHGANKPGLDLGTGYGKLRVPEEILEELKNAVKNR